MMEVLERIDGVVIGVFIGFEGGAPLVVFLGNPRETAIPARSLTELILRRSAPKWPCCFRTAIRAVR